MKTIKSVILLITALAIFPLLGISQTSAPGGSASISGRVTSGGKGAPDITVLATDRSNPMKSRTLGKTTTDDDGNYRLTGLAAGQLTVSVNAKNYVAGTNGVYKQPIQTVVLAENESVTKIDFTLVRGGVITGRVTDAEGRPVINEIVNVTQISDEGRLQSISSFPSDGNRTDDRGIYRVYGLAPGNFEVSVGSPNPNGGATAPGSSRYKLTYYPNVTDENKATVLEIQEGTEIANVDISPFKPDHGFAVSGRVVDADSGKPVADVSIGYSSINAQNMQEGTGSYSSNRTDADGRFRLDEVHPGHYSGYSMGNGQGNSLYSERTPFDVVDEDVTGIEIKLHRGASVSGIAVVENNTDPAVTAMLSGILLFGSVQTTDTVGPMFASTQIGPDGSFRMSGFAPGKFSLNAGGFPSMPKALSLMRVELDGVEQKGGINITADAQITGVRLVFAYGSGTIRGQVVAEGEAFPDPATIRVSLASTGGQNGQFRRFLSVDARGQFVSDGVPPGTYQITVRVQSPTGSALPAMGVATQTVNVTGAADPPVILTLTPNGKKVGP